MTRFTDSDSDGPDQVPTAGRPSATLADPRDAALRVSIAGTQVRAAKERARKTFGALKNPGEAPPYERAILLALGVTSLVAAGALGVLLAGPLPPALAWTVAVGFGAASGVIGARASAKAWAVSAALGAVGVGAVVAGALTLGALAPALLLLATAFVGGLGSLGLLHHVTAWEKASVAYKAAERADARLNGRREPTPVVATSQKSGAASSDPAGSVGLDE